MNAENRAIFQNAEFKQVTSIVVVAFLLRVCTLDWGIPLDEYSAYYHGDEVKSWGSIVDFPGAYLTSDRYLYGTAVQYLFALFLTPVRLLLDSADPEQHQVFELTVVVGFRLFSVILGTASVAITWLIARRLSSPFGATTAATLLCISPAHVMNSPSCTLDVAMSFLLVTGLLILDRAFRTGRERHFVQAGVFTGLLFGTKATGVFIAGIPIVMLLVDLLGPETSKDERARIFRWNLYNIFVIYLPVAFVTFAVSTPHAILSIEEYLDFMQWQKANWYDRSLPTISTTVMTWFQSSSATIGPLATMLQPFALPWICFGKGDARLRWSVALFSVGYCLFWRNYLPPRFVAFVAPLLCISTGTLLASCCRSAGRPIRRLTVLGLASVPLWWTVQEIRIRRDDPRDRAARFIEADLSAGATIGIATDSMEYTWRHHQWRAPQIDWKRFRERSFLDLPDYIIVSSIELERFQQALDSERLLEGDIWDERYNSDWYQLKPPAPQVFDFYRNLFREAKYERIRMFTAEPTLETGGFYPDIHVFARRGNLGDRNSER